MATERTAKSQRPTTLVIVTLLILLYLATLTADYYWDGVTFALQIEKVAETGRGGYLLFHQNHLLYNALGYLLYYPLHASGSSLRALYLLQIVNVFVGAVAVGVFFRIAERVTCNRYTAVISAAALAFSAVWWKLATDADAYMVSILLILICVSTLLSSKPSWLLAGLTLAGAMLVHQLASLFYPAAVVAIFTNLPTEKRWPFAAKFSVLAWGLPVAAYALCASLFYDAKAPLAVIKWAVSNPSGVSPSVNPLGGMKLLPRGNLDMIAGHSFALYRSQGGWSAKFLAIALLAIAIYAMIKVLKNGKLVRFLKDTLKVTPSAREQWRMVGPMLITWVGVYLVFLLFWEPGQILYRAFYLPPLALLPGLVLSNYYEETRALPTGAAALMVATLALFNLTFYIAPHMRTTANPLIATAQSTHQLWDDKTLVYFQDHNEADTTFEYFNDQTEWRRLTAAAQSNLDDEIQRAFQQGRHVWLNKGAAESVGGQWLRQHPQGREITAESPNAPARYVEILPNQ